jgi:hypothetical protein
MNRKKMLAGIIPFIAFQVSAQVGIGTETPDPAAILDVVSVDKGVLIPRVSLQSITFDLDGQPGQPSGLLVYNTGGNLAEGFYFWNGSEWENLESSSVVAPSIATLECNNALLEPPTFTAGSPYIGIMKVPYTGGNGGKYPGGTAWITSTSKDNPTLRASLKAGRLEQGRGYLVYDVVGVPNASSPAGANFPISFGSLSCEVKVGYTESATMTSSYSVGPLIPPTDGIGYQRAVTSFDGKFSVRFFVPRGGSYKDGQLQIRHNTKGGVVIMWNGFTTRQPPVSMAGNQFTLPAANVWSSGSWGAAELTVAEQRSYIWMTTDVQEKTVYHLTLMAGSSDNSLNRNIIYMKIEQIQAN